MTIQYVKSQSCIYPMSPDTTSSKKFVYIRDNITEVETTTENGEPYTYYEYDEAKLTKEEYEQYLAEINSVETLETIETLKAENEMLMEQVNMLTACIIEMSEIVYA